MTNYRNRFFKLCTSKRGESLVESIVSILVFTLLMLAVTTMLSTSINITHDFIKNASSSQVSANKSTFANSGVGKTLTFKINGGTVSIPIRYLDDEGVIGFEPVPPVTP